MDLSFAQGSDLVNAVRWASTQNRAELTTGSARLFTLVSHGIYSDDSCDVIGYGAGKVWLCRRCQASGIVGTEFLIDGADVNQRAKNIFKKSALQVSDTDRNKVKITQVEHVDAEGKVDSCGWIEVDTYSGDIDDIKLPNREGWTRIAAIDDFFHFKGLCRYHYVCSFSKDGATKNEQQPLILLIFEDTNLKLLSAERGMLGKVIITTQIRSLVMHNLTLAFEGRHLLKASEVCKDPTKSIVVSVDDLENPTRLMFEGDAGYVDVPLESNLARCRALTQAGVPFFYGENKLVLNCKRYFDAQRLLNSLQFQTPTKKTVNTSMLLEMKNEKLEISKRADIQKSECSAIVPWTVEGEGEWTPYCISYEYLELALTTFFAYLKLQKEKDEAEEAYNNSWMQEEEDEDWETEIKSKVSESPLIVSLVQRYIQTNNVKVNLLFLESDIYKDCRILMTAIVT